MMLINASVCVCVVFPVSENVNVLNKVSDITRYIAQVIVVELQIENT